MMQVLVLGGTRFIGKSLVNTLLETGQDVTISSRKHYPANHEQLRQITCERTDLRKQIKSFNSFDFVFDFTAYDVKDLMILPDGHPNFQYFLISTDWVTMLEAQAKSYLTQEQIKYVHKKAQVENLLNDIFGEKSCSIRLPKTIGIEDHHKRLNYYIRKLEHITNPVFSSETYHLSFTWIEDLISALSKIVEDKVNLPRHVRAISRERVTHAEFLGELATSLGLNISPKLLTLEEISSALPLLIQVDALILEELHEDSTPLLFNILREDSQKSKLRQMPDSQNLRLDSLQELAILQELNHG